MNKVIVKSNQAQRFVLGRLVIPEGVEFDLDGLHQAEITCLTNTQGISIEPVAPAAPVDLGEPDADAAAVDLVEPVAPVSPIKSVKKK